MSVLGIGFAAHIAYGLFRLGNTPRTAGSLAVAANVPELMTASRYPPSLAVALVAWPPLTLVPAASVALTLGINAT